MKVVVAEAIAEAGIAALDAFCEVDVAVGEDRTELLRRMTNATGLVVRSATNVDAEMIAAAPALQVIGRAGIGVDNIDVEAATAHGVLVVNAPNANTVSAAEHTMALLLAQARRLPEADASLRNGRWERSSLRGIELHGKTLGVLGLGKIGTLVAQRASAFGMRILAYDPYVGEERVRPARSRTGRPRNGVRPRRLHHDSPSSHSRDRGPDRCGCVGADEARSSDHQRCPRRPR